MNHQAKIQAAVAGIVALGLASLVAAQPVKPKDGTEKCYGVAKAGQNDCGTGSTRARARAPRPTTTRPNGSTSPRAPARRWAARWWRRSRTQLLRERGRRPNAAPAAVSHSAMPFTLPLAAGIGLRSPHVREVLERKPAVPWFEIHSENYFADGGPALAALDRIRADYPIAMHGVGLSLGSADPLDREHLRKLARLADAHRTRGRLRAPVLERRRRPPLQRPAAPALHRGGARPRVRARARGAGRSRSHDRGRERVELLRVPRIDDPRVRVRRRPSPRAPAARLLVDVNNIYVNARNHGLDPVAYLAAIVRRGGRGDPPRRASTTADRSSSTRTARRSRREVWSLYAAAIERFGAVPTLIEWDTDIPAFAVLEREAATAQRVLDAHDRVAA